MSYSDMDKNIDKILGKKAFSTNEKSFTMSTKTNNGVALKATTSIKGSTTTKLNCKFNHSSGVNFSKIDVVSDGKVAIEANCKSGIDGCDITSEFTMGTAKWLAASKKNTEKAKIGFDYSAGDLTSSFGFDFLAKSGDSDVVCFTPELCYTMDNLQFGADATVNFPSPFGGEGGATALTNYSVGFGYKTGDFDFVANVAQPGKDNTLSASFFNKANSTTKWGATFAQGGGADFASRPFDIKVGASFQNSSDMSTMLAINQNAVGSFKVTQALNGGSTLTLQTEIDFNNLEKDAKFGLGFDMKF